MGDFAEAEELVDAIESSDRWEWRAGWYRGVAKLAQGLGEDARASFMTVYRSLPGELAPKLALALACESAGDLEAASRWYEIVSRTDPSTTSASFGLARCRLGLGDRAGALAAYGRVPDSSSGFLDAQVARVRCLSAGDGGDDGALEDLVAAGAVLEGLQLARERRDRLAADVLERVLALALAGEAHDDGRVSVLGYRLSERDLRLGLERTYRALARHATSRGERIRLVDQANRTRPRTWT
jgi:serine/threonine-protein kinase PknG